MKIVYLAVKFGYDDEIIHSNTGLIERKSGFNSPQSRLKINAKGPVYKRELTIPAGQGKKLSISHLS